MLSSASRSLRTGLGHQWAPAVLFLAPALLALGLFRLVPFVTAFVDSLYRHRLGEIVGFVGLDNYVTVLSSAGFQESLGVTLLFSLIVNPLQITVAFALALLLAQPIRGVSLIRTMIFLPVAIPPAVASLIWVMFLHPDGVVNGVLVALGLPAQPLLTSSTQALFLVILVVSWIGVGFWMIFLVAGLNDIPVEYSEAAKIDGAGRWDTFRNVTLPLMRRPLVFVLVADTITNFLLFAPFQVLTQGGPERSTNVLIHEVFRQSYLLQNPNAALPQVVLLMVVTLAIVGIQFRLLSRGAE